jgi:glycosyltransferase involved in cell wall biosynthesis
MPTGVVVSMAAHNSAKYIQRSLASIDEALRGRPYAVVIADDNSKDDTVKIARNFPMRAEERIIVSLPKAPGIGESKNRALKLAQPFLRKYPWIAFMDDDDEMLRGRFSGLLEKMEAEGQKAGVGDWVHFAQGGTPVPFPGDRSLHTRMYAPTKTLIHRDVIPKDGNYFAEVPRDVHEDLVTHHRLALSGVPWCYHGGDPIHVYHQRNDSYTRGPEHSMRMKENTEEFLGRGYPESKTTIASFCTVALGPSVSEAEFMIKSLRLSKNDQPVLVLTDVEGASAVSGWGVAGVETMLCDPVIYNAHFTDFGTIYPNCSLNPGPFLGKMDVITEAAKRHGTTLYLDADMVVLRRFMDVISEPIGLAPELSRGCRDGQQSEWWRFERFGHFSGGYVFASRDGIHIIDWWRREFLKSWRWFGNDHSPHGGFTDQSGLDLAPLFGCVHVFHPGHNFMYTRVPRPCPPIPTPGAIFDTMKIWAGHGLFFRGWPIVTVHAHFRLPTWAKESTEALRKVIGFSKIPHHAEIYEMLCAKSP